ncbi:hypothetical protein IFM89_007241, partial [Coptis chinensis]
MKLTVSRAVFCRKGQQAGHYSVPFQAPGNDNKLKGLCWSHGGYGD